MKTRGPRRRGVSRKEKARSRKAPKPPPEAHPLFGEIPRIHVGGSEVLDYDPDYTPALPKGAVRGDVRKQSFCRMCHVPRYFYVDQTKRCVQCDDDFVFTAREQKHWYETLGFHFDSVAIRCPACRRKARTVKALRRQLAAARAAVHEDPGNPAKHLVLAESLVRLRGASGEGSLNDAVAAARRARRLGDPGWPGTREACLWEAWAHALAGRARRARELLDEVHTGTRGRLARLAARVTDELADRSRGR